MSGGVFLGLLGYFYYLYGYEFLFETYFYHLTRRDDRTTKSIYSYEVYLNFWNDEYVGSAFRSLMRMLPTLLFLGSFSFYFVKERSVFYCQGWIMVYFVLFNKVLTDQYYSWLFNAIILLYP